MSDKYTKLYPGDSICLIIDGKKRAVKAKDHVLISKKFSNFSLKKKESPEQALTRWENSILKKYSGLEKILVQRFDGWTFVDENNVTWWTKEILMTLNNRAFAVWENTSNNDGKYIRFNVPVSKLKENYGLLLS